MGLLYTQYKMFHFKEKIDSLPRNASVMNGKDADHTPPPPRCMSESNLPMFVIMIAGFVPIKILICNWVKTWLSATISLRRR